MPKTSDVGVIVGRFQVHRLHDAHHTLIQSIYDTHRHTVIVLGLSQARVSTRNPLDYEARKQLLLAAFPTATIFYLKDEPTDEGWSAKLDALIADYASPAQAVCLYGGRDSFIARYKGRYRVEILEPATYVSGTELRKSIARSVRASEDFRAGVIWASANGHPKVFPTVDVGIWRQDQVDPREPSPKRKWLFVRKPTESLWRFCGGFIAPTDASLEVAARREVAEETGLEIGELRYCWSGLIDDWRYRDEADKIMTTLFTACHTFGALRPADDVVAAGWFDDMSAALLVPEHRPLFDAIHGGR